MKTFFGLRLMMKHGASGYPLLRSESPSARKSSKNGRKSSLVMKDHVPLDVGEEMERFVVRVQLLNHPIMERLLHLSAEEYGYNPEGVLRIPCDVLVFRRILESLRLGNDHSLPGLL